MYLKHGDLTFTVCFRNWLHSTTTSDSQLNARLLMPALEPSVAPQHWKRYTDSHPPPATEEVHARIILGASKESGPTGRKRRPRQMAEAILAATLKHLHFPETSVDLQGLELQILDALYLQSKTTFAALPPVLYQSTELWAEVVRILRCAAGADTEEAKQTYCDVLKLFTIGLTERKPEYLDTLVACWVTGGLFDALEESIDLLLTIRDAGCESCLHPVPATYMTSTVS